MWLGALLTILALVALFWKFGTTFRQAVLGYDIVVDIAVTSLFVMLFAGTLGGMLIAITAGLLISVLLLIAKKLGTSRTLRITRKGLRLQYAWNIHHGALHKLATPRLT